MVALRGDCAGGESGGMRRRRRCAFFLVPAPVLVGAALFGDIGGKDVAGADLSGSLKANDPATALAGCDVGPRQLAGLPKEKLGKLGKLGKLMPALTGLLNTGVNALRNSVYAVGGVIGVDMSSPCLTVSEEVVEPSLKSSDGKTVVFGVFNGWRVGFSGAMVEVGGPVD